MNLTATILLGLFLLLVPQAALADEGQWPPDRLSGLDWKELTRRGIRLSPDEIWNEEGTALAMGAESILGIGKGDGSFEPGSSIGSFKITTGITSSAACFAMYPSKAMPPMSRICSRDDTALEIKIRLRSSGSGMLRPGNSAAPAA